MKCLSIVARSVNRERDSPRTTADARDVERLSQSSTLSQWPCHRLAFSGVARVSAAHPKRSTRSVSFWISPRSPAVGRSDVDRLGTTVRIAADVARDSRPSNVRGSRTSDTLTSGDSRSVVWASMRQQGSRARPQVRPGPASFVYSLWHRCGAWRRKSTSRRLYRNAS